MRTIHCGVYRIINILTKQSYVGGTIDIHRRWLGHKRRLRRGDHQCKKLQAAWNEFGEEVFELRILVECKRAQIRELEKKEIARLNSCWGGYNSTPLGAGADFETRRLNGIWASLYSNTAGLIKESRSTTGRARRSETMRRLNLEGKCGFNAPGVKDKALATRLERHGY